MEAKLIKVEDVYRLLREDNLIIGTTDYEYQKAFSDHCYKLSLKNCQAIERGYDLDEFAENEFPDKTTPGWVDSFSERERNGFKAGFKKRDEMLSDKIFSEEDMMVFFKWADQQMRSYCGKTSVQLLQEWKSLQQTEWDCIVEMECCGNYNPPCNINCGYGPKQKLDADGCLILRKI